MWLNRKSSVVNITILLFPYFIIIYNKNSKIKHFSAVHMHWRILGSLFVDRSVFRWNMDSQTVPLEHLQSLDIDTVIHLAGRSFHTDVIWDNNTFKIPLWKNRVEGSRFLTSQLSRLPSLKYFIQPFTLHYYQSGLQYVNENCLNGDSFMSSIFSACEYSASSNLRGRTVRFPRLANVLGYDGGVLGDALPRFRRGLGGCLGDKRRQISWISREDAARALIACADIHPDEPRKLLKYHNVGKAPVVCGGSVPNSEFSDTLARAISMKARLHVPECLMRLIYIQSAEFFLQDYAPQRSRSLEDAGFHLIDMDFTEALRKAVEIGPDSVPLTVEGVRVDGLEKDQSVAAVLGRYVGWKKRPSLSALKE